MKLIATVFICAFSATFISGSAIGPTDDHHQHEHLSGDLVPGHELHSHSLEEERRLHGKPGAEIELTSSPKERLPIHGVQTLNLELFTPLRKGWVEITIEPSVELEVLSEQKKWSFALDGTNKLTLPVQVYGPSNHRHFIHIFVKQTGLNGHVTSRALAVELEPSHPDFETQYAKTSTKTNERNLIISLPGVEKIY